MLVWININIIIKISASNCNQGKNEHLFQVVAATLKALQFSSSLGHLLQH